MEFHDYFLLFWIAFAVILAVLATLQHRKATYWHNKYINILGEYRAKTEAPRDVIIIDAATFETFECKESETLSIIKALRSRF